MTSFPFLKIARDFSVTYRHVLTIADAIDSPGYGYARTDRLVAAVVDAALFERQRRATIVHSALHEGQTP